MQLLASLWIWNFKLRKSLVPKEQYKWIMNLERTHILSHLSIPIKGRIERKCREKNKSAINYCTGDFPKSAPGGILLAIVTEEDLSDQIWIIDDI